MGLRSGEYPGSGLGWPPAPTVCHHHLERLPPTSRPSKHETRRRSAARSCGPPDTHRHCKSRMGRRATYCVPSLTDPTALHLHYLARGSSDHSLPPSCSSNHRPAVTGSASMRTMLAVPSPAARIPLVVAPQRRLLRLHPSYQVGAPHYYPLQSALPSLCV